MPFGVRLVCHSSDELRSTHLSHRVTNAFRREAGLSLNNAVKHAFESPEVTNAFRREAGLSPRVSLTRVGRAYKGPKGREWPLRAFGRGHGY